MFNKNNLEKKVKELQKQNSELVKIVEKQTNGKDVVELYQAKVEYQNYTESNTRIKATIIFCIIIIIIYKFL